MAVTKRDIMVAVSGDKADGTRLGKSENAVVVKVGSIVSGRGLSAIVKMSTRATKIMS
jgi:hypothetical protein